MAANDPKSLNEIYAQLASAQLAGAASVAGQTLTGLAVASHTGDAVTKQQLDMTAGAQSPMYNHLVQSQPIGVYDGLYNGIINSQYFTHPEYETLERLEFGEHDKCEECPHSFSCMAGSFPKHHYVAARVTDQKRGTSLFCIEDGIVRLFPTGEFPQSAAWFEKHRDAIAKQAGLTPAYLNPNPGSAEYEYWHRQFVGPSTNIQPTPYVPPDMTEMDLQWITSGSAAALTWDETSSTTNKITINADAVRGHNSEINVLASDPADSLTVRFDTTTGKLVVK